MRMIEKIVRRFIDCRSGTPALEFALIAPLFFATVLVTFDLGRALYDYNKLSAAVSLGARSIVIDGPNDEDAITALIKSRFSDSAADRVTVTYSEEILASQIFKKIDAQYEFRSLVKFGPWVDGATLAVERSSRAGDCLDPIYVVTPVYTECQNLTSLTTASAQVIDKGTDSGDSGDPVLIDPDPVPDPDPTPILLQ